MSAIQTMKTNLIELMRRDGVKLVQSGNHFATRCFWHREKTPSLHVWEDHYHCFGCQAHGWAWNYVKWRDNCSDSDARIKAGGHAARVFERKPEPVPDFKPLYDSMAPGHEKLAALLGLRHEVLELMGCRWSERHQAFAFPMRDDAGRITGIRLRWESGEKKAITGSKEGLFWPMTNNFDRYVVICEGPTDAAALLDIGLFPVGRPSAMGGRDLLLKLLHKRAVRHVTICSDNDGTVGMLSARKLKQDLKVRCTIWCGPCKDIREFRNMGGNRQLFESMRKAL